MCGKGGMHQMGTLLQQQFIYEESLRKRHRILDFDTKMSRFLLLFLGAHYSYIFHCKFNAFIFLIKPFFNINFFNHTWRGRPRPIPCPAIPMGRRPSGAATIRAEGGKDQRSKINQERSKIIAELTNRKRASSISMRRFVASALQMRRATRKIVNFNSKKTKRISNIWAFL